MEPKEKDVELQDDKQEDIELDDDKKQEDDTSKNDSQEDDSDVDEDDDKKEEDENPYEKKLQELEKENEKKDEMLRQKNAALKETREKLKKTQSKEDVKDDEKPLTKKEMLDLLEAREQKRESLEQIKELSDDPKERQLIQAYVNKGYNVNDAYVLANAHVIDEHKRMVQEEESFNNRESYLTKFSQAGAKKVKGQPQWSNNPILREAAKELDPEERKFLGK